MLPNLLHLTGTFGSIGIFNIEDDCMLTSEVTVVGSLTLKGKRKADGRLPKIVGSGSNRLFRLQSNGNLNLDICGLLTNNLNTFKFLEEYKLNNNLEQNLNIDFVEYKNIKKT